MSESVHESVSALADGELPRARAQRALDAVLADPVLREQWRRHHVVSDVLSGCRCGVPGADQLAERVRAELEREPVPAFAQHAARRRSLHPLLGAAMAASVALVAVIATSALLDEPPQRTAERPEIAARESSAADSGSGTGTQLAGARREPVERLASAAATRRDAALTRMSWDRTAPRVQERLNAYLLDHNEYLAGGVRGLLPYARVVGYDGGN